MGHRGIPPAPVDGEAYSSTGLLGLPLVLEYDDATGGFKLVVATEAGVAIYISGTVDTELGPPLTPTDAMANPNVPGSVAFLMGYDDAGAQWARARLLADQSADNVANALFDHSLITHSAIRGLNAAGNYDRIRGTVDSGLYVTMISGSFPRDEPLQVYMTGSVYSADTELPAAVALSDALANPTAPAVGAYMLAYDEGDNWIRARAGFPAQDENVADEVDPTLAVASYLFGLDETGTFSRLQVVRPTDILPNPIYALETAALAMGYYTASGTWSRLTVDDNDYLQVTLGTRLSHTLDSVQIGDGTDLAGVTADGCLQVQVCTGSVVADTELPAAVALSDALANPTAPAVGSHLLGYDEAGTQWVRARASVTNDGLLLAEVSPALNANSFLMGWSAADAEFRMIRSTPTGDLFVTMISGAFPPDAVVGTELPAAVALSDALANPTAPAVGAYTLAYQDDLAAWERVRGHDVGEGDRLDSAYFSHNMNINGVIWALNPDGSWDRMRSEGISGSYAFRTSNFAMGQSVWSPFINRSVVAWTERELVVYTSGSSVYADTELPDAVTLSDALANPTAPAVGGYNLGWDGDNSVWRRFQVLAGAVPSISAGDVQYAQVVFGGMYALAENLADWDIMRSEGASGSYAFRTSSWAMGQAGFEPFINRSVQAWGERELVVFFSGSSVMADTELPAAVAIGDVLANPTAPAVAGHTLAYEDNLGVWGRVRGIHAGSDGRDSDYFSFNMNVNAVIWGVNADGEMDRMRSEGASGSYAFRTSNWALGQAGFEPLINKSIPYADWSERELVVYFSGSSVVADTELPAPAALADGMAIPTTPLVGSVLMGYNGATLDRIRSVGNNADGIAPTAEGIIPIASYMYQYSDETSTWNRVTSPPPTLIVDENLNDSDKTLTVPAGKEYKILWMHIEYAATVAGGDRQVVVLARDDADDVIGTYKAGLVQASGTSVDYEYMPSVPRETSIIAGTIHVTLPNEFVLPAGYDLRIYDENAVDAAADDMIVQMMVDERTV